MARGYTQSRSEASAASQPGRNTPMKYDADGIMSDEDIKYRYSNTGYTLGSPKLLRQDAKNQITAIFEKTSPFAGLGLPDSPYVMDALDTMQKIAQGWVDKGQGKTPITPTTREVQEYKSIARRVVEQVNNDFRQEARYLRGDA